jgi:hypothetical protein
MDGPISLIPIERNIFTNRSLNMRSIRYCSSENCSRQTEWEQDRNSADVSFSLGSSNQFFLFKICPVIYIKSAARIIYRIFL